MAAAVAGVVMCAGALEAEAAVQVALVSRTPTGVPANGESTVYGWGGSLSQDGSIAAFASRAANLPQGDGSTFQVYVRNIPGRTTDIASVNNSGIAATSDTFAPAISPSGDLVAFEGLGAGLPQANGNYQIWVHDTTTGKTRLVSADAKGRSGRHGLSLYPTFSGERYVAFESNADNLPGGSGDDSFVYIRDLKLGKTILASKTAGGSPAVATIGGQALSLDARFVVFVSNDPGLPSASIFTHVYLRDRQTGSVELIDRANNGQAASDFSADASITPDARFVAFDSVASNLPGGAPKDSRGDEPLPQQCYVRDLEQEKLVLVSKNNAGAPQNGACFDPHMSADGRYVAFYAHATNLPGGDGTTDEVYVRDRKLGKTVLLSKAANGDPADDDSQYPSISLDGRWVEFVSDANNMGGRPAHSQVFRAGPIG
ncbi:MAG: hypothetical protein E6G49_11515 [Actinobacteria bacterium]|nr:MAG: hypothetical protein E6G49_11515 [Actinomycetota bacterium]